MSDSQTPPVLDELSPLEEAVIDAARRGTRTRPDSHLTPEALRHEPQRGCRRCEARHPGGQVLRLLPRHRFVCTRHQVWIGPPDQVDHPQPGLEELPEVVAAQHRHLRLLRRLGPAATYDAVLTGFLFCAHRWNFTDVAFDGDAWLDWVRRAELLIPPGTETHVLRPASRVGDQFRVIELGGVTVRPSSTTRNQLRCRTRFVADSALDQRMVGARLRGGGAGCLAVGMSPGADRDRGARG